jgi:hypothetical protein
MVYHVKENWEELSKGCGWMISKDLEELTNIDYFTLNPDYSGRFYTAISPTNKSLSLWNEVEVDKYFTTAEEWREIQLNKLAFLMSS